MNLIKYWDKEIFLTVLEGFAMTIAFMVFVITLWFWAYVCQ